jgi:hypothetical protein
LKGETHEAIISFSIEVPMRIQSNGNVSELMIGVFEKSKVKEKAKEIFGQKKKLIFPFKYTAGACCVLLTISRQRTLSRESDAKLKTDLLGMVFL